MQLTRRWLATVAASLGLAATGCQTWFGGMTLPSPRYLQHYPQYFSPDPVHPLPRELATLTDPEGAAIAGGAGPALAPPAAPVPVPPPAPIGPGGLVPARPGGQGPGL